MRSEKPHHNHPSALVGPPCTCIFPPQGLAVKMQGRGSILQKFDPPSTPFIWRRKHNGPNVLNKFGEKY